MEMRDEVLPSVGAQDLDTSSYQLTDLEDIESPGRREVALLEQE